MTIVTSAGGMRFEYPTQPAELTVGNWTRFLEQYDIPLRTMEADIEALGEEQAFEKELEIESLIVNEAYSLAAHFSGIEFNDAGEAFTVDEVVGWREEYFRPAYDGSFSGVPPNLLRLPDPIVTPSTSINFGAFIDSKVLTEVLSKPPANDTPAGLMLPYWKTGHLLLCIFDRVNGNETYHDSDLAPAGELYSQKLNAPLFEVVQVYEWYRQFIEHIQSSYALFAKSRVPSAGKAMKEHMKQWGWINFLKELAKTKVFDVPGLNSIDSVRAVSLFDVLVFASEDKEYGEAAALDQMAALKK